MKDLHQDNIIPTDNLLQVSISSGIVYISVKSSSKMLASLFWSKWNALFIQSKIMTPLFFQGVHPSRRVYKLVLTGGPCGGKTTGQVQGTLV